MTKNITIDSITDIIKFVELASAVDGDITCRRGAYAVDGKSLIGMSYINPALGIEVEYPPTAINFENFIKVYETNKRG